MLNINIIFEDWHQMFLSYFMSAYTLHFIQDMIWLQDVDELNTCLQQHYHEVS